MVISVKDHQNIFLHLEVPKSNNFGLLGIGTYLLEQNHMESVAAQHQRKES